MAAETHRAPRLAHRLTSMAAASAVARYPHIQAETEFAATWSLLWGACGGSVIVDGPKSAIYRPTVPPEHGARAVIGHVTLQLRDAAEVSGALKVLAAMVHIGGASAVSAVASYLDFDGEA